MQASLTEITPQWAQRVLVEKNIGNRAMNWSHVLLLAKEMQEGRWKVNGDTICLNGQRLIDGQHRLAAVVESGVTIYSFVVEGLPSDVFNTKDTGKRRSGGDTLGVRGEINAYRLAAALVLIDQYKTGRVESKIKYTNTEIELLLQKYPTARNSIVTSRNTKHLLPPSVLDACHYLFSQHDTALADEFVDKVISGVGLEHTSPWYVLRERLVRNSNSKSKLSKLYIMALCIKAWNAARCGATVKCLRWREEGDRVEAFPVVR